MQALVALIERYAPGLATAVLPADEPQIEALQRLAGPLPGSVLRFLRTLGGSAPQLLVESMRLGVQPMRRALLSAEWLRDERYLFLTRHEEYEAYIWIDRATPTERDDAMLLISALIDAPRPDLSPPVIPPKIPFAVGLEDMLYVEAFRTHRLSQFENGDAFATTAAPDPALVQRALALPEQLGFERLAPHLPSGLYERGDAALIVRRAPFDQELHLHAAAEDPGRVDAILQAFRAIDGWK